MGAGPKSLCLLNRRQVQTRGLWAVASFGLAVGWPRIAAAQSPKEDDGPVRVGDRWVYDTQDEMTGYPKRTYTEIVTDVLPKEITVNLTYSGKTGSASITYDHDWNTIDNLVWKYRPSDGWGIRLPLVVGKTWRSEFEAKSLRTGANFKGTGSSKVVAQESITTAAGTFDTFKIERQARVHNPSRLGKYKSSRGTPRKSTISYDGRPS